MKDTLLHQTKLSLSTFGAMLVISACSSPGEKPSSPAPKTSESEAMEKEEGSAHWSYDESSGPLKWAELDINYSPCADGKHQSPINFLPQGIQAQHKLNLEYMVSTENIHNNGHTVELVYDQGSQAQFDGKEYDLLQFHFHTPSEHMVNSEAYPLEMHMVHRSRDTSYLVMGLLFKEGKENSFLNRIIPSLPKEISPTAEKVNAEINVSDVLPADPHYYFYQGSFTTPPCTEGVRWIVLQQPLEASGDQIQHLLDNEGENSRPVQKLNSRTVELF